MSSDLRKSLESIQSLLSQNPSPMTATSLPSRVHRASLESGMESHGQHGDDLGRSPPIKQPYRVGTLRRGGILNEDQQQQRSSAVSVPAVSSPPSSSLSLVPIAEPVSGGSHHSSGTLHVSIVQSPQTRSRDSLSYTPFNQIDIAQQQSQHESGNSDSQRAPATPFQNVVDTSSTTPFQNIVDTSSAAHFQYAGSDNIGIVGSPSSAFSAVSKKMSARSCSAMMGDGALSGPPFDGVDAGGSGAKTPSGNSSVISGALGSVSSASHTGGQTTASSHVRSLDASAGKRSTFSDHHQYGGLGTMMSAGKHPNHSRRETSLLVSPVSQHSPLHSRSLQSVMSPNASGTPSGALGVLAGQRDASPPRTVNTKIAKDSASHLGPTGTPLVAASAESPSASLGAFASQHSASPTGTANAMIAAAPALHHDPAGTPLVTASAKSPSATLFAHQHASSPPGKENTTGASVVNNATHHGPTGTPFVASSSSAASHSSSSSKNRTPPTAGLTIHTNLQPANGRDPTPYHCRSTNPSITTSPYSSKGSHIKDKKDSDVSSSRISRDPPASSPFPTTINASGCNSASSIGFLITSKSTPIVHSHHYPKDHQTEEQELSMIEEDDSLSEGNRSLVSNVTGPTFVRTPIGRKLHGHNHTPRNNTEHSTATGHHSHGYHSIHSHGRAHHTPRSTTTTQHFQHTSPGSTASTAIHATPSKADLLHRPSLAMRESLAHLATMSSNALEEIWDCVGVAPEERATQLTDLVERISQLCEAKVQDEEAVRDQFRKEIAEARKEWEEICNSLMLDGEEDPVSKMRRDPSSKDLGRSLQLEYEAMMGRLESLRSAKQAAMADMQASQGKIYEAFAALHGCTIKEASQANEMLPFMDVETNLTQNQREAFRSKVEEYEESVTSRTRAIVSLLLDCQSIIVELEIVPLSEVIVGKNEDDAKIMNSLEHIQENGDCHDNGHRRGQSNHYTIVSLFESPTCIGISKSALDRLTNRISELNGEKSRRRTKLGEMGNAIGAYWSMLRVSQDEQRAFTSSIRGLGLDTLRKGEAEIARLDELKSVMIGKLVWEQRHMIEELWDKNNSSMSERATFDTYFHIQDEQLTSGILVKHEEYVATLKSKLEKMQPILDLIAKREGIIEERIELEFLQKDPDRLKGRGASKQLMKEEKMSRRVKKELPRITSNLEKVLWQWFEENKPHAANSNEEGDDALDPDLGHFMYQGSPYLNIIQCQEEGWQTRKERGEQERNRKRQEERAAASSANAAFGHTTYTKLPGKKWDPSANMNADQNAITNSHGPAKARPRSASNQRSGSNMRSGSNTRSGGSHPTTSSSNKSRSGSNMRFGGRGPLGVVSSSRQNASKPPPRPPRRGADGCAGRDGGMDRGKTVTGGGMGNRSASAPRIRL